MSAPTDGRSDGAPATEAGGSDRPRARSRRRGRRSSWAERLHTRFEEWPLELVTQWLAAAVVWLAMLAIGGVHPPVMLGLGALSSALVFLAFALRATHRRLPLGLPMVFAWSLAGLCLVQLVPLPTALLELLSPAAADVWARALGPFEEAGPRFAPLSLDPGATWVEALRWFSYGALAAGAAAVSTRVGASWASVAVFVAALAAALVALVHGFVGLSSVYGLYAPSFRAEPWHVGPLLNPNNLAGYLVLGSLAGLGLLFDDKPTLPRWGLGIGVAVLVAMVVVGASRGGVMTLIVGVVLFAATEERSMRRKARSRGRSGGRQARWVLVATVAFGVALAVLGSQRKTWTELFDENLGKLEMVGWIRPLLGDFAWFGVGRGAFESVFPAYQSTNGGTVFTHVENFPAQWLVEWGIPAGIAALATLAWMLRPARLGVWRSSAAAGAWCGILALGLQNLADLGLEIPAICAAVSLLLGALWGAAAQRDLALLGPERKAPAAIRMGTVLAGAGVVMCLGVGVRGLHLLDADRRALQSELAAAKVPRTGAQRQALRGALRAAILRHPAEPYFPLLGAVLERQEPGGKPILWLQRTLERSRASGRAHLLLAQVLDQSKAKLQALMELRLAVSLDPMLVDAVTELATAWADDEATLARVVPAGPVAGKVWAGLGARVSDRKLARRCDRLALESDPALAAPRLRLGAERIEARLAKTGCIEDEEACGREIERYAKELELYAATSSAAGQLRARWLAALGKPLEAVNLLANLCDATDDRVTCLQTRVTIAADVTSPEPLAMAARSLVAEVCMDERRCAEVSEWIGSLHASRGEWATAVGYFTRASQFEETEARLDKLVEAANRAGMNALALRTLERVKARRGGNDPAIDERIRALRNRVMERVVQ